GRTDRGSRDAPPHPGASDLPGTAEEIRRLRERFPGRVQALVGDDATRATVTAALPAARWAHFACHGTANLANPSASRLLLTDHQQQPLTVVDVARLRLDRAQLAFLSACETARPGGRLADEVIHLASAFQLAGYRHVIGTLWPISDQHAVDIADHIYTTLSATGTLTATGTATATVAVAVHTATRQLRDRWPHEPSVWASHIHAGA
ncbi:CHAT domain-containing protein, partial [Candidatus Protofrankia datiscae]